MKKILYISDVNNAEAIFHSQVIPHINELRKFFDVTLMVLTRENKCNENLAFNYNSIRGDYFYYLAKLNFINHRNNISSLLNENSFDLIYSRGTRGGIVGCFIKKYYYNNKISLLNDVRADLLDEHKNNIVTKSILHHANKFVYRNTDLLFLVSNHLKIKICKIYGFNSDRAFVFPTFVPDGKFDFNVNNRNSKRKELGFAESDIIVLYSGNLASWQNVDAIFSCFSKSENSNLKLLILTKDKNVFNVIKRYNINDDRIKIRDVNYREIEKYYHASDFGVLIRDNTDTNKSSSPTKFSEYVNSGLSVIINYIESDYIQLFKEKKLEGFLLNTKKDLKNCFDSITFSDLHRNVLKINSLGAMIKRQTKILNNFTNHSSN